GPPGRVDQERGTACSRRTRAGQRAPGRRPALLGERSARLPRPASGPAGGVAPRPGHRPLVRPRRLRARRLRPGRARRALAAGRAPDPGV
ncbi:MAG: hypothetical protein AVDCRST_MAG16-3194, partial [uncultured Frankineae bacterium]